MSTSATASLHAMRGVDIPSLDGVRAIAVALVFFAHGGLANIVPGGLGVTIFFVLSGYLISTLMRIEHAQTGRLDFRGFYLRRFFRLIPPLVVVVLVTMVLANYSRIGQFTVNGLLSVLFYYGNYFLIAHDYHGVPAGIGVVWSLAVEEHYYLLYPPLAAVLLRVGRRDRSVAILLGLCVLVLAWRFYLALNGASENYLTMATDTRVDAILFGCLLALWRNPWLDKPLEENPRRDFALIGASLAALIFSLLYREPLFRDTLRYTVQSGAVAVLLYFAVARSESRAFRWLSSRPLAYIGVISYTVYLSHHVILQWLDDRWPELPAWATLLLAVLLTLMVAEPMRRIVEQPCARLRRRLHKRAERKTALEPIAQPGSSL